MKEELKLKQFKKDVEDLEKDVENYLDNNGLRPALLYRYDLLKSREKDLGVVSDKLATIYQMLV